ncbi:MAG: tetratricopeptide repeat protein, partial [Verrucomicrobiota bacterium]
DGAYLDSLGWCLFKMGDLSKAEDYLLRAITQSPDEGVIMEHLAEVAIKRNNPDAAISWLEKATAQTLEPRDRIRIEARLKELRRKP